MSDNNKLKPIVSSKKLCQRNTSKQSINSSGSASSDDVFLKDLKRDQSSFKNFTPRHKSPRQFSPRRLTPIQVSKSQSKSNFNSNCTKSMLKIDKDVIIETAHTINTNNVSSGYNKMTKETYDDEQIYINKTNNIDVNVKVTNVNDDLVKELKYYANKINECKIVDNFTLDDMSKIKERMNNLENETTNLKLNYKSLITFTESMDELIDYFTSLDKEITRIYNISDEELLLDLLNAFKKIYTLINTFEKIKINIDINTQINLKLSTLELNSILNSVTTKIMNVNEQIIKFMNDASNKNIDEILNFLNDNDSEEINYALNHTLRTLDVNLKNFDDSSRLLKYTLNQLKLKIRQSK